MATPLKEQFYCCDCGQHHHIKHKRMRKGRKRPLCEFCEVRITEEVKARAA